MTRAILQLKIDFPDYPILVTGHSMGGALATFFATDLAHQHNIRNTVYSFGQPRVFDKHGREFFRELQAQSKVRLYRIVNGLDPVPSLRANELPSGFQPPRGFPSLFLKPDPEQDAMYYSGRHSPAQVEEALVTMLRRDGEYLNS